jgi:hypothetical protein
VADVAQLFCHCIVAESRPRQLIDKLIVAPLNKKFPELLASVHTLGLTFLNDKIQAVPIPRQKFPIHILV